MKSVIFVGNHSGRPGGGMKKIVLFSRLFPEGRRLLEGNVKLLEHYCDNLEDIPDDLRQADGILVGNQKISAQTLEQFPNLRLIAKQGSGYDNIDVEAADKRRIPVIISAGVNARAVAEHVMMLMLAASRKLIQYDSAVRCGNFAIRSTCQEQELYGKKLGLIGCGNIGFQVGIYAKAFGMEVTAFDPYMDCAETEKQGIAWEAHLESLLCVSDIISIHVPLTRQTKGMVGREQLTQMKKHAVLVNCSRGGIVDEEALYEVLQNGHLAAAGIDVFAREPAEKGHPLFTLPNVVLTPHAAALTRESSSQMSRMTAEGILAVLQGRPWKCLANPGLAG